MNTFTLLFVALLALQLGLEWWLKQRHLQHVHKHRDAVPGPFATHISLQDHQRAADYTMARTRLARQELLYGTALLLMWTLGGGLELLQSGLATWIASPLLHGVALLLAAALLMALLDLPFSWYRTFHLEQRFGFNHSTPALFISDLAKQTLLLLLLGGPLAALVLWLMESSGSLWWFHVWLVWQAFSLFLLWAWPSFIAPLFNTFTPLDDKDLASRIEDLLERCGFGSSGIYIMDGSRRSAHGNAYFTGLGKNKRIVFFDTLLKSLDNDEIEAVLAHELGHFHHRHIRKRLFTGAVLSLAGLALLGQLSTASWFFHGLGVKHDSMAMALLLFLLVVPVFAFFLQPLLAFSSRKHEFEADAFAVRQSTATHLGNALVKLYQDNASTLTPDPLHSAFHDSHPPAPVRIAALQHAAP